MGGGLGVWVVLLLVIKYGRIIICWRFRGVGDISKLFVLCLYVNT